MNLNIPQNFFKYTPQILLNYITNTSKESRHFNILCFTWFGLLKVCQDSMLRKSCSSIPRGLHYHASGCFVLPQPFPQQAELQDALLALTVLVYFSRSTSECHLISVHPEAQGQLRVRGQTQSQAFVNVLQSDL